MSFFYSFCEEIFLSCDPYFLYIFTLTFLILISHANTELIDPLTLAFQTPFKLLKSNLGSFDKQKQYFMTKNHGWSKTLIKTKHASRKVVECQIKLLYFVLCDNKWGEKEIFLHLRTFFKSWHEIFLLLLNYIVRVLF